MPIPVKEYLDPADTEKLEAVAGCLRDKLLVRLLRRLGCRVGEVLNIAVEDIDFSRRQVTIEHLKTRMKLSCPQCDARLGKKHIYCPGCGKTVKEAVQKDQEFHRRRKIPLDRDTLHLVQEYIDRGGPVGKNGRQILFGFSPQWARQVFRELARKAGLPHIVNPETGKVHHVSPHKLRDAFAINAVKKNSTGDGLRLLQEHLGHQSIVTTMRYRKVAGEELQDWYDHVVGEQNGGEPTREEIGRETEVLPKVREIMKVPPKSVPLETLQVNDRLTAILKQNQATIEKVEDSCLRNFLEGGITWRPRDAASRQLLKEQIDEVPSALLDRERKVLITRFGLEDGQSHTLDEVGRDFGVTRERIRQIQAKALKKLRGKALRKLRRWLRL